MKGMKQTIWFTITWLIGFQVQLFSNLALAEDQVHVAVVKGSNNSYFNQTIQTLINLTSKSVRFNVLNLDSVQGGSTSLKETDLIITLGASATQVINSNYPEKLMISAYLTEKQLKDQAPQKKGHLAVLLDQPLSRYIAFSHLVSNANSIGILNRNPVKLNRKQRNLLQKLDLNLTQYQIEQSGKLLPRIRQLLGQTDTLLMLPDHTIYNRDTLKGVLLTAYRSRTAVISYSPAHVKSGALASIYSSPSDIGRHLADLLDQYLREGVISSESQQYARYFSTRFNHRVSRAYWLTLPDEAELRIRLEEVLK